MVESPNLVEIIQGMAEASAVKATAVAVADTAGVARQGTPATAVPHLIPVLAVVVAVAAVVEHLMGEAGVVLAFVDKVPMAQAAATTLPVVKAGEAAAPQRAVVTMVVEVFIMTSAVVIS